jgi:valyl-tRNA synthetase
MQGFLCAENPTDMHKNRVQYEIMKHDFPKRYNRPESEAKWREIWENDKTYAFSYDVQKPMYSVDTPPPYVSADHLHAGHIMSYTQAEFIVRFKRMQGYNVFYPMGFDDNGLPTERFVEKKHKIDKSKITRPDFIKLCLEETEKGSKTYKDLWSQLGISVDWTKTYSTISPIAVKMSQWSLIDIHEKGGLYQSELPILWCPFCETALAQADLEDEEQNSKMNYINFLSEDGKDLMVATTRPELIPACVALYVNPNDKRYADLIGKKAIVPLMGYKVPIKASEAVDIEVGTGLMMVCTWGDQEDVEKWRDDKLDSRALVTEDGKLNEEFGGPYAGLVLLDARKKILEDLGKVKKLVKQEDITHVVNVHERCSTPVEFVLSKQWFIKVADKKETWLELGKKLKWYPEHKRQDYDRWVESLKWDWCISRQRYYGVPFPVWYCADCGETIFAKKDDLPVYPTESKPNIDTCPKCGGTEFIPDEDVMDTWATSSCTPFLLRELVADNKEAYDALFPPTLRPNAFEIIRTWDFYSIVKSHYNFDSIPFKDVMISGHGLDEKGHKFSKRLGNYIPSDELLETYGADPIRFWATGATLGQNLRFSEREVERGKRTTTKLWNVGRFIALSSDAFEYDPQQEPELEYADKWMLEEMNKTIGTVTEAFEGYTYARAREEIENFFWSKVADYYIEFIKYRLFGNDEVSKRSALWTLHAVFEAVLKMYAPIMPYITEEIHSLIYAKDGESIHLSEWPQEYKVESTLSLDGFNDAIRAIDEIRKYKSDQNISLGSELPKYVLETKIDMDRFGEFVKRVMRVEKLS